MSYWKEAQALRDKLDRDRAKMLEKHKNYRNPGMLDGDPYIAEEHAMNKTFSDGLRALREKYPDWRKEAVPKRYRDS